jgi:cyclic pyranopterin monophosphate synthase
MKVDVSEKPEISRLCIASGKIYLKKSTIEKIKNKEIKKGDVFFASEIAAINAVKITSNLLPFCHNIQINNTFCEFILNDKENYIEAKVTVKTIARTGVEMEALTGVLIALNNIWDMVKYLEKDENGQYIDTKITDIMVLKKKKG